jgi:outer membrane protein assembly factor BamD
MTTRRLLLATGLLLLGACAGARTTMSGDVKYGATAEENYAFCQAASERSDGIEAQKLLEHVRTKYPFSKYAALAELRLADAKYKQDRFLEAGEAYAAFVKLHPGHDEADHAEFQSALCSVKDAPSDFALFPPAEEKDLKAVRAAAEKLQAFLKDRPASPYRAEAEKLLRVSRDRLAAHEWYVADFYLRRRRWAGAAGRLEGLLKDHPGSSREPEAMLRLAQVYLAMKEDFRAQQAAQRLVARYPDDPRRAEAEALLAGLRK